MKVLKEADVFGKRVIVWTDLDVPVEKGRVIDDTRLTHNTKTIRYLLENKAKILLLGHCGRPQGRDPSLSLKPICQRMSQLLGLEIELLPEISAPKSEMAMIENIRFWPQEKEKDEGFAENISKLGDLYINDCFSTSHHAGATMIFLPKFLPSYIGLSLEKETSELSTLIKNPKRPLVAIIGGAKLDTKLPAITNLSSVADTVLVGGKIMFEALKRELPQNVVVAVDDVEQKDVGPKTIELFKGYLNKAAMIVWNGPMGMIEKEEFMKGTQEVAKLVVESGAYSVVGGGETIEALVKLGFLDKISFVSMGGGAMLDFLSGKKLPGLEAIGYYD